MIVRSGVDKMNKKSEEIKSKDVVEEVIDKRSEIKGKANSKKGTTTVKKKDNTIKYLITFIVLFSIVLIATVYSDIRSITQNVSETKEYNKLYEELLEEEASLNSEVIKLQDPEYVARYAREKFMYTKDGELILKIVDGKVLTTEDVVEEPANKEGEE